MKKIVNWVNAHTGPIIALASALGIFSHAISPEFAEFTGDQAHKIMMFTAIIGSIMTAYAQGAGEDG